MEMECAMHSAILFYSTDSDCGNCFVRLGQQKGGPDNPARLSQRLLLERYYGVEVGGCVVAGHVVPGASGGGQTRKLGPVPPIAGRIVAGAIEAAGAGAGVQPLPSHVASNNAAKV